MRWLLVASTFLFGTLLAAEPVEKIRNHMLIGDFWSARDEAKKALKEHPQDAAIYRCYIEALIALGDEKKLVRQWHQYREQFGEDKDLLEKVCWGIIKAGGRSSSPQVRIIATLAAYLGRDIKGVEIITCGLGDNNAFVRGVAAQLAAQYPDRAVQKALLSRLPKEQIRPIKVQVIQALGAMRAESAKEALYAIAADDREPPEVKAAAAIGWVNIVDDVSREQVERLVQSDSWGLRLLACQLLAKNGEDLDIAKSLLQDHHATVRSAALVALGLHKAGGDVENLLDDPDDDVAITAAWFSTINGHEVSWDKWLKSENPLLRVKAAAALNSTGLQGVDLIRSHFLSSDDPYVRLNLAFGLIGLRDEASLKKAVKQLSHSLVTTDERWCYNSWAIFGAIIPNRLQQGDDGLIDPETTNQLVRLEALSKLSVLDPKAAQEAILAFLSARGWGVTGAAAALLLQEGNHEMVQVTCSLLDHENKNIRVQAALILSMWGRDSAAIETLQASYSTADRSTKERILEGLGRVGDEGTLSFLDNCLDEPFQTLRLITASSIIQTINH